MQNTIEYDRGWSSRWLAPLGWLGVGLAALLLLGAVSGWVEVQFEFGFLRVLLFYFFMLAAACFALIKWSLEKARIRFNMLGLAAALLMMIAFLGSDEYASYRIFRQSLNEAIHQQAAAEGVAEEEINFEEAVDYVIYDAIGVAGFRGFLSLRFQNSGMEMVLRVLVAFGVAMYAWDRTYQKKICPTCGDWVPGFVKIGGMPMDASAAFLEEVKLGSFYSAGKRILQGRLDAPRVNVYLSACKNCRDAEAALLIEKFPVQEGGKIQSQKLLEQKISSSQYQNLLAGVMFAAAHEDAVPKAVPHAAPYVAQLDQSSPDTNDERTNG